MGFDLIFLVIMGMAFLYGFFRGFLRQLLSLVGLLTAFYMAINHPHRAINLLSPYIKNPELLKIAGGVVTFIAVYLFFAAISMIISFVVKGSIGLLDRLLGGLFALAKALVLFIALVMLLISFDTSRNFVLSSRAGPYLVKIGSKLVTKGKKLWKENWDYGKNSKGK